MAVIVALAVFVVVPLLSSSVGAVGANEVPCPNMAAMTDTVKHEHVKTQPAPMPEGHADDMDCCNDAETTQATDLTMADCSFACKADCLYTVTAILMAEVHSVSVAARQANEELPPRASTPHADGFTTPPPRI